MQIMCHFQRSKAVHKDKVGNLCHVVYDEIWQFTLAHRTCPSLVLYHFSSSPFAICTLSNILFSLQGFLNTDNYFAAVCRGFSVITLICQFIATFSNHKFSIPLLYICHLVNKINNTKLAAAVDWLTWCKKMNPLLRRSFVNNMCNNSLL